MFHSARLTLTIWYTLIATLITLFFSFFAYNGFRDEFERGLRREVEQHELQIQIAPPPTILTPQYFIQIEKSLNDEFRKRIIVRILVIDAWVVVLSAIAGYFLAGKTLKPIQDMVDEQNRFISDASHELRTPLTAARTSLEVGLRDKHMTLPQARLLLKSNLEDIASMQTLTESLLHLAQGQNGVRVLEKYPVSLEEILSSARQMILHKAEKKRISLDIPSTEYTVLGNKDQLIELFVILLDNGVKYSEERTYVQVKLTRIDGHVMISVIDTGIGIPAEDIPYIFDRFYRADKARNKSHTEGFGLGLSIAKQIVEMHDGTISVKSKGKKGSTFMVKLPLASNKKKPEKEYKC